MSKILIVFIRYSLLLILFSAGFGQVRKEVFKEIKISPQQKDNVPACSENLDKLYNREKVLEQLANILNRSVPEFAEVVNKPFAVKNERGNFFFVYDLTDPLNKSSLTTTCIDLINNHIYHFAPIEYNFSFSHIVILEDGSLKVFKSIDCWNRGDKLENVISYVSRKLEGKTDKDKIIERIKNFRKYGMYFYEDTPLMPCKGYEVNNK